MKLFGVVYRFKNRKAKSASDLLREGRLLKRIGVDSLDDKANAKTLVSSSKVIYKGIFLAGTARYREDLEELDRLLENIDTNERAVVEYLKSEIWNYEEAIAAAVDRFIRESEDIMGSIGRG